MSTSVSNQRIDVNDFSMIENLIIRDIEVPFLLKQKQSELNALKANESQRIEEKELEDIDGKELLAEIDNLEDHIKVLEAIRQSKIEDVREKFLKTQGYNIHLLIFYTSKEVSASIDQTVKKYIKRLTYQLLDSNLFKRGQDKIYILLDTNGGMPDTTIQIYDFLANYFKEPTVIIPDSAWSAGTLFSLCCHRIILLENALLGPIDVQVVLGDDDGYHKSAFSYIEGVDRYLDLLMGKVNSDNINPDDNTSVSNVQTYRGFLKTLMLPINLMKYGYCSTVLSHASTAIAVRHYSHKTTCNNPQVVKQNIWHDFTLIGHRFGHEYGLDFYDLQTMKSFEDFNDYIEQIQYGEDLFRWIDQMHYFLCKMLHDNSAYYFLTGYKEAFSFGRD